MLDHKYFVVIISLTYKMVLLILQRLIPALIMAENICYIIEIVGNYGH
jgi:hypothetical protein